MPRTVDFLVITAVAADVLVVVSDITRKMEIIWSPSMSHVATIKMFIPGFHYEEGIS